MRKSDPWILLKGIDAEAGLAILQSNLRKESSASSIMELGVAYLWLKKYQLASKLFNESIAAYPKAFSSFYGMAATSQWCLDNSSAAVKLLQSGVEVKYADTNGLGIHLPLLLYTTSVLKGNLLGKNNAIKLLKKRTKDFRVQDWPGPLAQWILREIDEVRIKEQTQGEDETDSLDRKWLLKFYTGLKRYDRGQRNDWQRVAYELTDTSQIEWLNDDFFLLRMWSEEYFIARHEASGWLEAKPE